MKYWLVTLFLLASCGTTEHCRSTPAFHGNGGKPGPCYPSQIAYRIHPTVEYAVEQFAADAVGRDVPCYTVDTVGFLSKLPPELEDKDVVGFCKFPIEVRFMKRFWDHASANQRLALVYHELGHCALRLEHDDTMPDIMNSYLLPEYFVEKEWDSLVNKLFERAKK